MKRSYWIWAVLAATTGAAGCIGTGHNVPPAPLLKAPGPGVTGPGPGVLTSVDYGLDEAAVADSHPSVQVMFAQPEGMHVYWDVGGGGQFDSVPLVVPGRYTVQQLSIYRMKLTSIPGHEGTELYPTLEIAAATPRSQAFLAHSAIPVQFTVEDFNQVATGNFVTKVIYLPDPEFQELAVAGVDTLVSTRLDPGVDPIVEADRRGAILAVVRLGNKDMEAPGANIAEGFQVPYHTADGIVPAGYYGPLGGHVAGLSAPPFGMPITGTPIGLPGPPHIPLGIPAGLEKHVIKNHTPTYIPDPTKKVNIHVKQYPHVTYPEPRDTAWIHQYNHPNCAHCVGAR